MQGTKRTTRTIIALLGSGALFTSQALAGAPSATPASGLTATTPFMATGGTVSSSLTQRASRQLSVKDDFGAALDGTTSDQTGFNAARLAAPNGSIIYVPHGEQNLSQNACPGGSTGLVQWIMDGVTYPDGATPVISTGCPGDTVRNFFNGTQYFGRNASTTATGGVLRVDGTINHTGGTVGPVGTITVNSTFGVANTSYNAFPWGVMSVLNSYGRGGGQPVSVYAQALRWAPGSSLWGDVGETRDMTGAPSSIGGNLISRENDLTANGNDDCGNPTYGCRIMQDYVIASAPVTGVSAITVGAAGTGGTDGSYALTFTGGLGTGITRSAAGTYTIAGGVITATNIIDPGLGYTSAPTITTPLGGISGASLTATTGQVPATVGTVMRVGARIGQGSIGTVLRSINNTPLTGSVIDATGFSLGSSAAVMKMLATQPIDFSGDMNHTLTLSGSACLNYAHTSATLMSICDSGADTFGSNATMNSGGVAFSATGSTTVGFDTSSATLSGAAYRLKQNQNIAWEATGTVVTRFTGSALASFYGGTTMWSVDGSGNFSAGRDLISPNSVRFSTGNALTATGTTQGTALALTADISVVTTTAAGTGVILRSGEPGARQEVFNRGANALLVYPFTGAQIEAAGANVAVSLAVGGHASFECMPGATQCYQAP